MELLNNINSSLLNILSEQTNFLIWAKDLNGDYIFSNKEFSTKILLTKKDETSTLFDSFTKSCLLSDKEVVKKNITINYKEYIEENNIYKVYDIVKSPLLDKEGNVIGVVGTANDITNEILLEKELKQNYYYDEITKLPNKKYLEKYLSELKLEDDNFYSGAILLDIDDFKFVNDTLGHKKGDTILTRIAKSLNKNIQKIKLKHRNVNIILTRFGGDKFLIFIENISEEKDKTINFLISLTNSLSSNMKDIFNDNRVKVKINLTVSSGIDFFLNNKINKNIFSDKLLKNLELALYSAKIEKDIYKFYVKKLSDEQSNILEIGRDLHKAIKLNEFELYFQPQFIANKEKLFSAEVLIRWNHPIKGIIPPDVFIPIAEDKGLILELGRWIIEESIKVLSKWQKSEKFKYLELAVNVSVKQFHDLNFIPFVEEKIIEYNIDSNSLMFELTESIFSENIEVIINKMENLNDIGLKMSLDDFGTGFSSLSYLKQLPLKQIKIDKSFVDDILTSENDKAIVLATIFIGSTMGLDVIAEGIEKYEQSVYLKKIGCTQFQGYLFSKPLQLHKFEEFVIEYDNSI